MDALKAAAAGAGGPWLDLNSQKPDDYLKDLNHAYETGGITKAERDSTLIMYEKAFAIHALNPVEPISMILLDLVQGKRQSEAHHTGTVDYMKKTLDKKFTASPGTDVENLNQVYKATKTKVAKKMKNVCAGPGCTVTEMEYRHANPGKHGLQLCGRCKVIGYCSKECQTKHWKAGHKAECQEA